MKRQVFIIAAVFLIIAANVGTFAQEITQVDEFGRHSTEDLMARLDNLHIQLYNNEGSTALIRIYAGKTDYLGFPSRYLAVMKAYLINHKVDGDRIIMQDCDGESTTQYKLYLVTKGAQVPICNKTSVILLSTTLFDSYYYSYEYPGTDYCCSIPGSDIRGATASLSAFAGLLNRSPESRAYVIAYNGTNVWSYNNRTLRPLDAPGKATRTQLVPKTCLSVMVSMLRG